MSKGSEYAIAGLVYIAWERSGGTTGIEEVSRGTGISSQYIAKIFRTLASRGIVSSQRGRDGGFSLARDPGEITLLQVVEAIDGPVEARCIKKTDECPESGTCQLFCVLKSCAAQIAGVLSSHTIGTVRLNFFGQKQD